MRRRRGCGGRRWSGLNEPGSTPPRTGASASATPSGDERVVDVAGGKGLHGVGVGGALGFHALAVVQAEREAGTDGRRLGKGGQGEATGDCVLTRTVAQALHERQAEDGGGGAGPVGDVAAVLAALGPVGGDGGGAGDAGDRRGTIAKAQGATVGGAGHVEGGLSRDRLIRFVADKLGQCGGGVRHAQLQHAAGGAGHAQQPGDGLRAGAGDGEHGGAGRGVEVGHEGEFFSVGSRHLPLPYTSQADY